MEKLFPLFQLSLLSRKESLKSASEESGLGDMTDNNNLDSENSAPNEMNYGKDGIAVHGSSVPTEGPLLF